MVVKKKVKLSKAPAEPEPRAKAGYKIKWEQMLGNDHPI
jgi:hypothetical protein